MIVDSLEEDKDAKGPEGGEQGIVDEVEDSDEGPGLGCASHDGPGVRLVQKVFDGVHAMALDGLDGGYADGHGGSTHPDSALSVPVWSNFPIWIHIKTTLW